MNNQNQPVKLSITTTINEIPLNVNKFFNEIAQLLGEGTNGLRQANSFMQGDDLAMSMSAVEAVRRLLFKADQRLSDCSDIIGALMSFREEAEEGGQEPTEEASTTPVTTPVTTSDIAQSDVEA